MNPGRGFMFRAAHGAAGGMTRARLHKNHMRS